MLSITQHGKERMIERIEEVSSVAEAKRMAKQAKHSGKPIGCFQQYPEFFSYLQDKKCQSNSCSIKIYKNYIYIWKGKHKTLITVHGIPEQYLQEMIEIDKSKKIAALIAIKTILD